MTAREPTMSIGDVVAKLRATFPDVSHSSLRFLEREGFVSPARTPGGHRLYTQAHLDQILRIKRWQANRLSLDEIRTRLANPDAPMPPMRWVTASSRTPSKAARSTP